jgi:hypothetical protein
MINFLTDVCTLTGAVAWAVFIVLAIAYASGIVDLRLEKAEDEAEG